MEIGNPNSSTVVVDSDGNVLQFMKVSIATLLTKTINTTPLVARKQVDDSYYLPAGILDITGNPLYTKFDAIDAWDMDTAPTKTYAHGLGSKWQQIIGIEVSVINDAGDKLYNLRVCNSATGICQGGISYWDDTNIYFWRLAGGIFDSVDFNDGGMIRLYVKILYWS